MTDKRLGYILMLLILLLVGGVYGYLIWLDRNPLNTITLRFPQVGSLALEDPVRMKGTLVGQISGFDHDSLGRVLVYVQSPKPIPVRASSRVAVKVKGVMGERFIEIGVGNPEGPLVDTRRIIDGDFEMGPSEAVAYMDLLAAKITELKDITERLRHGEDGKRSFVQAFNDVANTVDTLVYTLLTGLGGMEDGLDSGLDSAARFIEQTARLTSDVSVAAPKLINGLNTIIVKIDTAIPKIEKVIAQTNAMVDSVDNNKILWGDHLEKLQKQLAEIRKAADNLREEGLPLTIKLKLF
ncbi:MAG: MlaD family protein [Chitinispirillales bacterium]|jgi:phospholipid/cholesterol/gamma-HCH transport system substrate-binding protein|nr:MlaD family protein [Chitinispirillales bacterium]